MKVLPIKIKTIVNHVYCPNCGHHSTFTYTTNIFKNIVENFENQNPKYNNKEFRNYIYENNFDNLLENLPSNFKAELSLEDFLWFSKTRKI